MGRIKEITARILFVVMFMTALGECNTLAMASEIDGTGIFESVVKESNERDESESSGAVYFEEALDDMTGESDSLTEYAESILERHNFYNELTDEEKVTVRQELGLREDTMGELCEKGYTIEESRGKAILMQQLDISLNDVLGMTEAYGSEEKARSEALKFRRSFDKYTDFYSDENEFDVVSLMIRGYEFEDAVNICVVKNCIVTDVTVSDSSVTVMDIAASEGAVAVSDETLNNNDSA